MSEKSRLGELLKKLPQIEEELRGEFQDVSRFLFENPELGMEEFVSSQYLVDYLRSKGFTVEFPYADMPTAFRAEFGTEGPRFAFLAEYDALPGYGEEKKNAHACGHNWIGASTVGAGVVLSRLAEEGGFRVSVIGTPAEENFGAKVTMADAGVFSDVDIAFQAHLGEKTSLHPHLLAMDAFLFEFRGKASHASAAPWDGINALDSVQLMFMGVNALRQYMKPDVRIHGIVEEGGQAPNIVVDKASCRFYVRAAERSYLNTVSGRVIEIAKGAAMMSGATMEHRRTEMGYDNLIKIPRLQELADKYLLVNDITDRATREEAMQFSGSSDIGNVSHVTPTLYFEVGLESPEPMKVHEESALLLVDSDFAYTRLRQVVRAMAGVALEAALDEEVLGQIKSEFEERKIHP